MSALLLGLAGAIGAGGSYLSGVSANKTAALNKKEAQKAEAKANYFEGLGLMEFQANRAQKQAAEKAKLGLDLSLGTPGTYEMNYEDYYANMQANNNNQYSQMQILPGTSTLAGGTVPGAQDVYDKGATDLIKLRSAIPSENFNSNQVTSVGSLDSMLKASGISGGVSSFDPGAVQEFLKNPTAGLQGNYKDVMKGGYPAQTAAWQLPDVIDPKKFDAVYEQSRQFRQASYMTAQADQILRKQGPLYESMKESVLGPIFQGAAALQRTASEDIAKQIARGGSARITGLKEAERFREMDRINADRTNALWQANLALDQWSIDNSRRQLLFNQQWIAGIPGIRDDFTNAMTNLSQFFSGTMVPTSLTNAYASYEATKTRTVDLMGMLGGALVMGAGIFGSGLSVMGKSKTDTPNFSNVLGGSSSTAATPNYGNPLGATATSNYGNQLLPPSFSDQGSYVGGTGTPYRQ